MMSSDKVQSGPEARRSERRFRRFSLSPRLSVIFAFPPRQSFHYCENNFSVPRVFPNPGLNLVRLVTSLPCEES